MTIDEFIQTHDLVMTVTRVPENPNLDGDEKCAGWARESSHWFCRITFRNRDGAGVKTYFSQGAAHVNAPTLETVLDTLASDASGVEDSFEDWADSLGYDTDSRRAFRTYEIIQAQSRALRKFLSPRVFATLLNVERL